MIINERKKVNNSNYILGKRTAGSNLSKSKNLS